MHGDLNLLEIALVVVATLSCGLFFERLKQPAVLGYILAGVLLGPAVLKLVSNRATISALAELGVLMLLFLIGMELSLKAFKTVWHQSLLTTLAQISGSLVVVLGVGKLFDLSFGLSVLLACAIALSSTAVAIKMLESIQELRTETGRITVGVLIAQDLAIVPIILFLKGMENGQGVGTGVFLKIGISIGLLAVLIWYLSRRQKLRLPFSKIFAGNHDLEPLIALMFCFGAAVIAGLLGLSAAYGAFLGGLILGNTTERHRMIEATKPIQSVLMMVFFLSIGLLLDFAYIWDHLGKVLILLLFITIGKTALNIFVLKLLRQPWERAFLSGLILSQMGEFAFLLATVGVNGKLIDGEGARLVVSLAALSLTLSPFWMMAARRLHEAAPRHIASLNDLVTSVYGREVAFLGRLAGGLKELYTKGSSSLFAAGHQPPPSQGVSPALLPSACLRSSSESFQEEDVEESETLEQHKEKDEDRREGQDAQHHEAHQEISQQEPPESAPDSSLHQDVSDPKDQEDQEGGQTDQKGQKDQKSQEPDASPSGEKDA